MPTFYRTFKEVGIVLIPLALWAKEDKVHKDHEVKPWGFINVFELYFVSLVFFVVRV
jgi:hypothetical protein